MLAGLQAPTDIPQFLLWQTPGWATHFLDGARMVKETQKPQGAPPDSPQGLAVLGEREDPRKFARTGRTLDKDLDAGFLAELKATTSLCSVQKHWCYDSTGGPMAG